MIDSQAKKFLDAVLLLLFFVELGGMFLPTAAHECLGIAFMILLILHNVKNRHFYANIRRGKYSARRMANTVCVFLFALSLSAAMVSGVVMSKNILPQIGFADVCNWRSLHLGAAIFSLVLLFVHLFFHAGKYIHGKSLVAVSALIFVLAATGIFGLPYLDRWYHQVNVDKSEILRGEKIAAPGRVLTVYFSRVGNTDFPPGVDAVSGASIMKDREEIIGNAEMIALIVQDITWAVKNP